MIHSINKQLKMTMRLFHCNIIYLDWLVLRNGDQEMECVEYLMITWKQLVATSQF